MAVILLAVLIVLRNYPLLLIIIGYYVVTLAAVAIHELGHFIAGWSVGLRLEKLVIGPFTIKRDLGRWRLQFRLRLAGLTHMSVQRISKTRRNLLTYYSGGPLFSILAGAVALGACRVEKIGGNPLLGLSMAGFAIVSLLLGIQGLRPVRSAAYAGDGLLLRSLRSYEAARQQIAAHAVQMLRLRGVDRSQWNRRWVRVASQLTEVQWREFFKDWLEYESAVDPACAAECLERCLAGSALLSPEDREQQLDDLFFEAASFTALHRRDAAKAEVWFKRAEHPECASTLGRIKAEATLHSVRGDLEAAMAKWESGLDFIHRLPPGERTDQVECQWRQLKTLIEEPASRYCVMKTPLYRNEKEKLLGQEV